MMWKNVNGGMSWDELGRGLKEYIYSIYMKNRQMDILFERSSKSIDRFSFHKKIITLSRIGYKFASIYRYCEYFVVINDVFY